MSDFHYQGFQRTMPNLVSFGYKYQKGINSSASNLSVSNSSDSEYIKQTPSKYQQLKYNSWKRQKQKHIVNPLPQIALAHSQSNAVKTTRQSSALMSIKIHVFVQQQHCHQPILNGLLIVYFFHLWTPQWQSLQNLYKQSNNALELDDEKCLLVIFDQLDNRLLRNNVACLNYNTRGAYANGRSSNLRPELTATKRSPFSAVNMTENIFEWHRRDV